MDETLRIILIIIVSVSIFGLLLFVWVKNYMKRKIEFFLEQKNKKILKKINYFFVILFSISITLLEVSKSNPDLANIPRSFL